MAKVNDSILIDWKDGDVVDATEYKQERNILQTAINDNYDRLVKKVQNTAGDGTVTTFTLSKTDPNLLFKEGDNIKITINATTGELTIANVLSQGSVDSSSILDGAITTPKLADGAVTLAKLDPDLTVTVEMNAHRTEAELDHPDGSVTRTKLASDVDSYLKRMEIFRWVGV